MNPEINRKNYKHFTVCYSFENVEKQITFMMTKITFHIMRTYLKESVFDLIFS